MKTGKIRRVFENHKREYTYCNPNSPGLFSRSLDPRGGGGGGGLRGLDAKNQG